MTARANLKAVPRSAPTQQPDLPLPPPPARPFVSLARETHVGAGPVRKHVYQTLASYCPLMAKSWAARGHVYRETLLRVTEIAKLQTLDKHLSALRADGWITWERRGQKASEFEVRLRPELRITAAPDSPLEGESGAADSPLEGESRYPISGTQTPHLGYPDSPLEGEYKATEGSEDPLAAASPVPTARDEAADPNQRICGDLDPSAAQEQPTAKQIKLLEVCADRLGAEMPGSWLRGDRRAVQRQIKIAMQTRKRDRDWKHQHGSEEEILIDSGRDGGILWRGVVQRCTCGALRSATLYRDGSEEALAWVLCSELAEMIGDREFSRRAAAPDGDIELTGWREPMSWSEIEARTQCHDGGHG